MIHSPIFAQISPPPARNAIMRPVDVLWPFWWLIAQTTRLGGRCMHSVENAITLYFPLKSKSEL